MTTKQARSHGVTYRVSSPVVCEQSSGTYCPRCRHDAPEHARGEVNRSCVGAGVEQSLWTVQRWGRGDWIVECRDCLGSRNATAACDLAQPPGHLRKDVPNTGVLRGAGALSRPENTVCR